MRVLMWRKEDAEIAREEHGVSWESHVTGCYLWRGRCLCRGLWEIAGRRQLPGLEKSEETPQRREHAV